MNHDDICNDSANPRFDELPEMASRRRLLQGAAGLAALGLLPGVAGAAGRALKASPFPAFTPIAPSTEDLVRVPAGYSAEVLYAWGDPISDGPAFRADAGNSAAEQAAQAGMHHDGMHFFPFIEKGKPSSRHGLLCVNHEYTDDGLLHPGGMNSWSAEKVAKSKAAHGVSIVELREEQGRWRVVRPSRHARRVTAETPAAISGPAAGHALLRTAADPEGRRVLGTLNNCAHGVTPWGTFLSCEENFNFYFEGVKAATAEHKRYGLKAGGGFYRWHEHDERFDMGRHPHEAHRFGWVVEIDPRRPDLPPVKRTALGRIKHEGAFVTLARDRRVVVYMGDDERFEYIYKFVSRDPYVEGRPTAGLLDEGTLHVARFDAAGHGRWLPLTPASTGFADAGEVAVFARVAADRVGATKMDRPEWIAVDPKSGEAYCSLTNNAKRDGAGVDAANPRAENVFGHIVRWREAGGDAAATEFRWDIFLQAGDPAAAAPEKRGTVKGDGFGSPDGLWFDAKGRLWVQTDVSTGALNKGDYATLGNNQMLLADPATGETRRFLTGPRGSEITGITATPDGRTLFVNIQHPGEPTTERNDPAAPEAVSAWPHSQFPELPAGRPRSATVVIRREDGGKI